MKPTFVTIFPYTENVHLIKDVGQVANAVGKNKEFNAKLVCYKNSEKYTLSASECPHLTIDFIEPQGKTLFLEKAVLNYLKQHAQNIDVLHLFHLTKESIYYGLHYKKLNPKGKIYLKMDVVNEMLKGEIVYSKKKFFQWFHQRKAKQFLKQLTAISAENPTAIELLKTKFPELTDNIFLMPNGINCQFATTNFPTIKSYKEKENIILSVGRIGAPDKNYVLLLEAFMQANLPNWKLILVGEVTPEFQQLVDDWMVHHPKLKDKIELTGKIIDRKTLYEYYNRAKIFCLSSPKESFGIAFIEAMYFGNYLVGTTGMSSFEYISNSFLHGEVVVPSDTKKLSKVLEKITTNELLIENHLNAAHQRVLNYFCWDKVIEPLLKRIS
ncbi:MAG TPA: glycosyltransferase family 4 protein [Vicingaceae bacterium]